MDKLFLFLDVDSVHSARGGGTLYPQANFVQAGNSFDGTISLLFSSKSL